MSAIKTGGPAFPSHGNMGEVAHEGMTLRDYFATHASDEDVLAQAEIIRAKSEFHILPDGWRITARFMHADAMLKAR